MTSIPRGAGNIYEFEDIKAKEPEYSTVSYTWGRWRIEDDSGVPSMLPINNTPWKIPTVKETHFTRKDFQKVVGEIHKEGLDWIWIDVGCIDQRRSDPDKQAAIEIGRQANIFKQAKSTFVWLSRLHEMQLRKSLDSFLEHSDSLYEYVWYEKKAVDLDLTMGKLRESSEEIFADPWFSSLWTLQEVVLRNDAIVLSTEGEPVLWKVGKEEQRMYLTMLINHCQNVYGDLERISQRKMLFYTPPPSKEAADAIGRVKELILQAGFYYLFSTNPNVQYGTARYRTTSRREDRIYAIMQIYNLCIGKSARPNENPPLEYLVTEFAGAINQRCAILGQLFVHTTQPRSGFSWKVTEQSTVPEYLLIYRDPNCTATIKSDRSGNCAAAGKCCELPVLLAALEAAGTSDPAFAVNGWGLGFRLFLDSHIDGAGSFRSPDMQHYLEKCHPVTRIDYEKVRVLCLGSIQGTWSSKSKSFDRLNIGLLLNALDQDTEESLDQVPFERIGLVTWVTGDSLRCEPVNEICWQWCDQLLLR